MVAKHLIATLVGLVFLTAVGLVVFMMVSLASWVFGSLLIGVPVVITVLIASYFAGRFIFRLDEER
ncbi:hypothetical protein [Brevibacillus laterosporus]|uniref:hypothetical protein n=1 Tax=Brevibacillus laterosporus TaxID=1465 RepID=UPI000EAD9597|nr:hypothetical protein [Brevibacillus laterosporus]AYK07747.1 hypothetical protein D8Z77_15980 [Brevibacillus laterosporus]